MSRSRRHELGVGLLLVAALAVSAVMALQIGALDGLGRRVHVSVSFSDVNGLTDGASVAIAGVQIGEVESLVIDHDHAVVGLAIDPDAGVLSDAHARVRARSMLGEKFIAIEPQGTDARLVQDGDILQSAGGAVEMDQMMSQLQPLISSVDTETLARVIGSLSDALEEDPDRLSRMLANADTILANGARASEGLPPLVDEARAAVREGRGTLRGVDRRVDELGPVLTKADGVLTETETELPLVIDDVRGLVGETRAVVADVDGTTDDLAAVLANLSELDRAEIQRLLREEGVLVRLKPRRDKDPESR